MEKRGSTEELMKTLITIAVIVAIFIIVWLILKGMVPTAPG